MDFNPKTHAAAAAQLRVGDIIMERHEHPAQITRLIAGGGRVSIFCRYVWQGHQEPDWRLGRFSQTDKFERAVR